MDNVKWNTDKLLVFVEMSREMRKIIEDESSSQQANKGTDEDDEDETEVMKLLGVTISKNIEIRVPDIIRNKGCGTKKKVRPVQMRKHLCLVNQKQGFATVVTNTSITIGEVAPRDEAYPKIKQIELNLRLWY
ncbi:hypothetical protein L1887_45886 [Cichorium endivia]|nr:hypothetical protein L1887_45886 [Cichorium endivia]